MMVNIEFLPSDHRYPHLEMVAEDIAYFIHTSKSLLGELNTFMRVTGGDDYKYNGDKWLNTFVGNKKRQAPDKLRLADLLRNSLNVSQNLEEWKKMRGYIPEKIYEQFFQREYPHTLLGFGVKVSIDGKIVIYSPVSQAADDGPRRTVDAGSWSGDFGVFTEVKFRPDGFGAKEFGYLNLLEKELDHVNVNHQIFLVSFDDGLLTRRHLIQKGLLSDITRFKVLGREDIVL